MIQLVVRVIGCSYIRKNCSGLIDIHYKCWRAGIHGLSLRELTDGLL